MTTFRKAVLPNGVRLVAERMPTVKSVTIGIWVNVGSRDEDSPEAGLSHFIEHMFFKGTRTRTATDISREIDALGGEMNAFTTRESTAFYVKVLDQQLRPAVALLADVFHHSRFESKEVEKEKQVVLEELRMVQDDPEDLVQDLHAQQAFGQHPLGRPILGDAGIIRSLRREQLLTYLARHYHPLQTVIAVAGNFQFREVLPLMEQFFGSFERSGSPRLNRWPPEVKGGLLIRQKPLEQAHLCLGMRGLALTHKDRYVAHVLSAVLGGSVSSRLFQEIREKRGLAYSIYSYLSSFSDAGMLTIYAATRPREAARVAGLIRREVRRLCSTAVARKELERAKNQMKGSLMLGLESSHSVMSKLAKDELFHGRRTTSDEMIAEIDRVSVDQVLRLSRELLDLDNLCITALGPVSRRSLRTALS
jgi:predicted Zn-dependent peptidase